MKKFAAVLIASVLAAACGKGYYDMSPKQFESLITSNRKVHVIDVREPDEYLAGHIRGALNIPVSDTAAFIAGIDSLRKKTPFAVYCRTGVRSARASAILASHRYTVYNLSDGIEGWKAKGLPVVESDTCLNRAKQEITTHL